MIVRLHPEIVPFTDADQTWGVGVETMVSNAEGLALAHLAQSPPGTLVACDVRVRAIMLDPERTSPGACIAVKVPRWPGHVLLRPGEVLPIPESTDRFYAWNANGAVYRKIAPANAQHFDVPLGHVAFLGSTDPSGLLMFRRDVPPRPAVSPLWYMSPILEVAPTVWTAGGLCSIPGVALARFSFQVIGSEGVPIAAPADLAGTVRVYTANQHLVDASGMRAPPNEADPFSGGGTTSWNEVHGASMAIGEHALDFVRTPPPGALALALAVLDLAGTDVASLGCTVSAAG